MIKRQLCLSIFALCLPAFANSFTVHNTGVNGVDVVQPIGSATSFWTLLSEPGGAGYAAGSSPFRYYNGAYYADNAVSGWVSPGSNGTAGAGGIYLYQMTFDLTGLDPASAIITGTFGTDNSGSIALNANAPVATTGSGAFNGPTAFTFNSGFVSGINTIVVGVNNEGDPTAFRVEFASATANPVDTATPEPGTVTLLCGGLVALIAGRKRFAR